MQRIEEFTKDGKNFIYFDFSEIKTNDEFIKQSEAMESVISKYQKDSVYTVTNIENIRFDSRSKDVVTRFLEHNKPYVKFGAIFGLDGIKKIMISTMIKLSGRNNMHFTFSKEKAIEWLLEQE